MEVTLYNWGHLGGIGGNFGDKAMLETQLYHLSNYDFDKINIFSTDIEYTRNRVQKFINCDLNKIDILKFPLFNPFDFLIAYKLIKNSDILIVGGGEIIYDETSGIYSILNLYPCLFKKTILFGVGATEDKYIITTRLLLNSISKNMVKIFTRDIRSSVIFSRYFDKKLIYDGTDIVFAHPYLNNNKFSKKYIQKNDTVVIIPRIHSPKSKIKVLNFVPYEIRKYLLSGRNEYILIKKRYFEKVSSIVNYLVKEHNIKNIVIVPFSTQIGRDDVISLELKNYLDKKTDANININKIKEIEDFINILASSSFSIPSTYHGVITSSMCGVKTYAISYSNKVNEICKNLSIEYHDMRNKDEYDSYDSNIHKYNFLTSNNIDEQMQQAKIQYENLVRHIYDVMR